MFFKSPFCRAGTSEGPYAVFVSSLLISTVPKDCTKIYSVLIDIIHLRAHYLLINQRNVSFLLAGFNFPDMIITA